MDGWSFPETVKFWRACSNFLDDFGFKALVPHDPFGSVIGEGIDESCCELTVEKKNRGQRRASSVPPLSHPARGKEAFMLAISRFHLRVWPVWLSVGAMLLLWLFCRVGISRLV